MASDNIQVLTADNFKEHVLESDVPVLVDFWATWCGPCKALLPTLEAVADDYVGRAKIAKLNTQDFPKVAQQYNVRMLPTLLVIKKGQVIAQHVGLAPRAKIQALIDQAL